jgi:hypothetical protein
MLLKYFFYSQYKKASQKITSVPVAAQFFSPYSTLPQPLTPQSPLGPNLRSKAFALQPHAAQFLPTVLLIIK